MTSAFLRLTVAAVIGVDAATVPANVRLFFSGFAEGSSNNKYLEIYNAGTESANLGDWAFPTVSNGPTTQVYTRIGTTSPQVPCWSQEKCMSLHMGRPTKRFSMSRTRLTRTCPTGMMVSSLPTGRKRTMSTSTP
ncbi:unnamed protein product [Polarella glacialis]|uniref:LTD domain-containing protein n=1 Tax=Polarella glacialis TaxID=89957 RepID=A0A813J7T2_POLGL|nr:unnamed protein product [Polarella glacialis]